MGYLVCMCVWGKCWCGDMWHGDPVRKSGKVCGGEMGERRRRKYKNVGVWGIIDRT